MLILSACWLAQLSLKLLTPLNWQSYLLFSLSMVFCVSDFKTIEMEIRLCAVWNWSNFCSFFHAKNVYVMLVTSQTYWHKNMNRVFFRWQLSYFLVSTAVYVNWAVCIKLCIFSQGSRDNMSIVIVAFDGAPRVSEEAQQKEAELDSRLEAKVRGV